MRINSKDAYSNNIFPEVSLRHCTSQKKISSFGRSTQSQIIGEYMYSQLDLLGKGYSSKVYKCRHRQRSEQIYAIKVIDTSKFRASSLQMLNGEIEIQKSLDHPNVVRCIESFKIGSMCYIITQFCEDGDLMGHLQLKRRLEEKNVIEIIKQILAGYRYLIQSGILHRDLKPANIFRSGETWKIGDFGFAVRQTDFKDKINVGTPLYMPLEALMKNKYSIKSDIFAIAIIAYELVLGRTPWQCSTEKQLIKKMSRFQIEVPSFLKSDLLRELITKGGQMEQFKRLSIQQFEKLATLNDNPQQRRTSIAYQQIMSSNYKRCGSPNYLQKLKVRQQSIGKIKKGLQNEEYGTTAIKTAVKSIKENRLNNPIEQAKTARKTEYCEQQALKSESTTSEQNNASPVTPFSTNKGLSKQIKSLDFSAQIQIGKIKTIGSNLSLNIQMPFTPKKQLTLGANASNLSNITDKNETKLKQASEQPFQHNKKTTKRASINYCENAEGIDYLKTNTSILLANLQQCRFIYYLMKNVSGTALPSDTQQNLRMLLFKHLLKSMKHLQDRKENYLGLVQWQSYKTSEVYSKVSMELKQYSLRYEREYLDYLKSVDVNTIRVINKNFPELSQQGHSLTITYYQNVKKYLKLLIRTNNHNLCVQMRQNSERNFNKSIQTLHNLVELYKLVGKAQENLKDKSLANKPIKVKVLTDYSLSKLDQKYYFETLRKELLKI